MSQEQRLRRSLKQIQTKILSLGPTNKARWTVFSTNSDMSVAQFARRMATYGIMLTSADVTAMWKLSGLNSQQLTFKDFENLLKADIPSSPTSSPSKQKKDSPIPRPKLAGPVIDDNDDVQTPTSTAIDNIQAMLCSCRRALLMKCLDNDPKTTGRISKKQFIDNCLWFGTSDQDTVTSITNSLDEDHTGFVNYMAFVDFLCGMSTETESSSVVRSSVASSNEMYQQKSQSPPPQQSSPKELPKIPPTPPRIYSPRSYDTFASPSKLVAENSEEDTFDLPSSTSQYQKDELIFGEYATRRIGGSAENLGPRRNLDPTIFGSKPSYDPVPRQRLLSADEVRNAEVVGNLPPGKAVELISQKVFKFFHTSKQAFSKWRQDDLLSADDLRDGLARDCGVKFPREDIAFIVQHYGGPMNISTFARMLSDGNRLTELNRSPNGRVRETEDEEMINDIAGQIRRDGWEDIVLRCSTAEELSNGFLEYGVKVTPEVLHTLESKYGKTGLIDALRLRTR
ncbi:hypothetical protein TVAG_364510 [Trichomonas vaginalis G3]|uniref:Uncharacterized protein n=1 Tax=Trichomonas vaginalis (strain ATCC PRA-98 / G3) TaxID=412133 RepID=A2E9G2_TRIV3|nr:EF-hand family [Trichomonas vaginalis G3]EAY10726.1 hypothetical protein TVAG_364510 [Trichomonas vaginalis G3]KAI5538619.1 EF-hand family [Trichomonas vaginalis G3]|eukprot:XP_001322949.1 hypothetical protein [Trichomonas vaginalis G3]